MGGIRCYKEVLDGRARTDAEASKSLRTLEQVLDCLQNTMTVSPETAFDEEMEEKFLTAASKFVSEAKQSAESYAVIITELEEQVRKKWPWSATEIGERKE